MPKYTSHSFVPPYLEGARERMEKHVAHIDLGSAPDQYVQYDLSPAAIVNMLPEGGLMGITMILQVDHSAALVIVEVEYADKGPAAADFVPFINMFRSDPYAISEGGRGFLFQFIIERPLSWPT